MKIWILSLFVAAASTYAVAQSEDDAPPDAATSIAFWRQVAPLCDGFPAKADCNDGDMVLFSGLLCAAGEQSGCAMVRQSQADDGRWWRSPRRVDGNLGERHSFSRDMAMGVMLYLVSTHDTTAAQHWVEWIEGNRACAVSAPIGDGCLIWGAYRLCRDDDGGSCTITPATWALLSRVFEFMGLPLNDEMRASGDVDTETMLVEARMSPVGYALHLVAVEILLKELLDATPDDRDTAAARILERQPDNPFFQYLVRRDDSWWGTTLRLCPQPGSAPSSDLSQWSWERDTAEGAWANSMAWDCLFLAGLSERAGVPARRG